MADFHQMNSRSPSIYTQIFSESFDRTVEMPKLLFTQLGFAQLTNRIVCEWFYQNLNGTLDWVHVKPKQRQLLFGMLCRIFVPGGPRLLDLRRLMIPLPMSKAKQTEDMV